MVGALDLLPFLQIHPQKAKLAQFIGKEKTRPSILHTQFSCIDWSVSLMDPVKGIMERGNVEGNDHFKLDT